MDVMYAFGVVSGVLLSTGAFVLVIFLREALGPPERPSVAESVGYPPKTTP